MDKAPRRNSPGTASGSRLRLVRRARHVASASWPLSCDAGDGRCRVQVGEDHGVVLVRAAGELDIAACAEFIDALSIACGSNSSGAVAVEVSGLTFMDASGLGVLVTAHKRLLSRGCPGIAVRGAAGIVRRVFEVTQMTSLLDDRQGRELDAARRDAGRSVTDLYIAYFGLGGTADLAHLSDYLAGRNDAFDLRQRDVAAHAVNERFIDLGRTDRLLLSY